MELLFQLVLPLFGQVGRAEDCEALCVTAVEQLPCDQCGLNRLSDPDVVSDEQPYRVELQGHQQWDELVWTWFDRDAAEGAERTCGRADAKPQRVAQQARAPGIAGIGRVRRRE